MMKVALFTDLHLGIHGNSEEWHEIALNWADWFVSDLKKRGIDIIFFLGDFFDNRTEINVQTLHVASQIIEKFNDFSLIMIVGNHDAYYKNRSDINSLSLFKGHDNIEVYESVEVLELGKQNKKKLLFVSWENEIPKNEKFDYIFGHFEIQSYKMNNFKVCEKGLAPVDLLNQSNTIFSGHFHNRNSGSYNNGSIHYLGNPFPMDFSDTDNTKGYHILDIMNGTLEFVENTISPRFYKIGLKEFENIEKEKISNGYFKLLVDEEIDEKELEKIEIKFRKDNPKKLIVERNVTNKTINDVEEVDSVEVVDIFEEFIEQLELVEEEKTRVNTVIEELYAICKS